MSARLAFLVLLVCSAPAWGQTPPVSSDAVERAIEYLAREVPRWSRENNCFSCHNNGDGARALFAALQQGKDLPEGSLTSTVEWLQRPGDWETGPANPIFSDNKLMRIQFAAALRSAWNSGLVAEPQTLIEAADSLLPFQEPDGSWQVDSGVTLGSPATYGSVLATHLARQSLEAADAARFAEPIQRAAEWLRRATPRGNLDVASLVLALPAADPRFRTSLNLVLDAQNADGGWGAHAQMPSEPFDTAIALLALMRWEEISARREPIRRGREFLIVAQLPSGGWPATTRPSGGQSYAQHISTSAWVTLALLATDAEGN